MTREYSGTEVGPGHELVPSKLKITYISDFKTARFQHLSAEKNGMRQKFAILLTNKFQVLARLLNVDGSVEEWLKTVMETFKRRHCGYERRHASADRKQGPQTQWIRRMNSDTTKASQYKSQEAGVREEYRIKQIEVKSSVRMMRSISATMPSN